jgi:hypothetical protein
MIFMALRNVFAPANETPVWRTLVRRDTGATLVRSVAPLVRETNVRAKDLVILSESNVGTSLDVIHPIFAGLNSDSTRRGLQKSVSPCEERLRLVGNTNGYFTIKLRFTVYPDHLRLSDCLENLRFSISLRNSDCYAYSD